VSPRLTCHTYIYISINMHAYADVCRWPRVSLSVVLAGMTRDLSPYAWIDGANPPMTSLHMHLSVRPPFLLSLAEAKADLQSSSVTM
jgi:hypothetical protein